MLGESGRLGAARAWSPHEGEELAENEMALTTELVSLTVSRRSCYRGKLWELRESVSQFSGINEVRR
jgi:hypothetical protein